MYNQTLLGQYGGVDISTTPDSLRFESLQARVRNTDAYEKIARHDFQLGAAVRMLPDSNDISTMTLYFMSSVRGYRDLENIQPSNGIFVDQFQHTRWFGIKLTQHLTLSNQEMDFGGEIQSERVHLTPAMKESSATRVSIFGKSEIPVSEILKLSPYGKFDNYKEQHLLSYGGDATFSIIKNLQLFGGYSRSYRIPTFQERMGTDTLLSSSLTDNLPERHHLFEVGIRLSNQEWYSFQLRSFHRTIWNLITVGPQSLTQLKAPYEFTRHQKKIIQGVAGTVSIRFGSFYAEGEAQFLEMIDHDDEQLTFPKRSATGGIYFWDKLLNNHLDLKVGVSGRVYSSYLGKEFNQQAQVYLPEEQLYNIEQTGVIDLVILLHIGKAYIHFIWDNLLNRQYIMATFYPMPERQMRFGVSWEFLN
jgi:outer membrane cobalamin receptor